MTSHHIHAALVRERHGTFLAEAQAARLARQVRIHGQRAGAPGVRRTPLRRLSGWLRPVRLPGPAPQGKAGRAARRVNGADPAGPQH